MNIDSILEKILDYYREKYEVSYNIEKFGMDIPYVAKMSSRQERTLFGIRLGGTPSYGPEASESVFILTDESFTCDTLDKLKTLVIEADKEFAAQDGEHSFTFFSAVAVVNSIDAKAAGMIKKFKLYHNYKSKGWVIARLAVFSADGDSVCNKDGADLKRLIQNILKA